MASRHATELTSQSRPTSPDPALLAAALDAVVERRGGDRGRLRWRIGEWMDRRNSTIFPLRAESDSSPLIDAFYKIHHPGAGAPVLVREELKRSKELTDRFEALVADEGILAPSVLAVDLENLTIVTVAVPGRSLGQTLKYIPTNRSRKKAIATYNKIGRACRLVERVDHPSRDSAEEFWVVTSGNLARAESALERTELDALRERLHTLYERTARDMRLVYVHGDIGTGNIMIDDGSLGFIDFRWKIRFPGFDLAKLVFRLEHEQRGLSRWIQPSLTRLSKGTATPISRDRPVGCFIAFSGC